MSALTFTLKNPAGTADIDCGGLTADALAGKTTAEVAALPLLVGGRTAKVDDVFNPAFPVAEQVELLDQFGQDVIDGRGGCHGALDRPDRR